MSKRGNAILQALASSAGLVGCSALEMCGETTIRRSSWDCQPISGQRTTDGAEDQGLPDRRRGHQRQHYSPPAWVLGDGPDV